MQTIDSISSLEIIELLNKCWMTHDGTWFFHCLQACGIETTNRINKAAIKSLSSVEIKRIKSLLGFEKDIDDFETFLSFFTKASHFMIPDFMNVTFDFPRANKMTWVFPQGKCFAHEGVSRLSVIEKYECGVLYRIQCWLEELGIQHKFNPGIDKCLMHLQGNCAGEIDLIF